MIDPVFGQIEFRIDAWDGIVPFQFTPANTTQLAVHIWSDESGPCDSQRSTFRQFCNRLPELWPTIAAGLAECHPELKTVKKVQQHLNPTVGFYLESGATHGHHDFELAYGFDVDCENNRGFFVRVVGWQVESTVLAE